MINYSKYRDSLQNKKDTNDQPIGYNNGLYLNKILKDIPIWDKDKIKDRTKEQIEEILRLFAFPNEKSIVFIDVRNGFSWL